MPQLPLNPSVISDPNWATSAGGLPIGLHKSIQNHSSQKPILFMGGTHGDEPEGIWLAEMALECLASAQNFSTPWYLISCLNPDGASKNQRVNGRGVDLNRNFPEKNWSSYHTAPRYFPGPEPASEPEVRALVRLIDEIQPRLIIHCHSWKPCIVLTGNREVEIARVLSHYTGYQFLEDIGYPTPGSLGEYGWREKQIPVICIEIAEKTPRADIDRLFRRAVEEIFLGANA